MIIPCFRTSSIYYLASLRFKEFRNQSQIFIAYYRTFRPSALKILKKLGPTSIRSVDKVYKTVNKTFSEKIAGLSFVEESILLEKKRIQKRGCFKAPAFWLFSKNEFLKLYWFL